MLTKKAKIIITASTAVVVAGGSTLAAVLITNAINKKTPEITLTFDSGIGEFENGSKTYVKKVEQNTKYNAIKEEINKLNPHHPDLNYTFNNFTDAGGAGLYDGYTFTQDTTFTANFDHYEYLIYFNLNSHYKLYADTKEYEGTQVGYTHGVDDYNIRIAPQYGYSIPDDFNEGEEKLSITRNLPEGSTEKAVLDYGTDYTYDKSTYQLKIKASAITDDLSINWQNIILNEYEAKNIISGTDHVKITKETSKPTVESGYRAEYKFDDYYSLPTKENIYVAIDDKRYQDFTWSVNQFDNKIAILEIAPGNLTGNVEIRFQTIEDEFEVTSSVEHLNAQPMQKIKYSTDNAIILYPDDTDNYFFDTDESVINKKLKIVNEGGIDISSDCKVEYISESFFIVKMDKEKVTSNIRITDAPIYSKELDLTIACDDGISKPSNKPIYKTESKLAFTIPAGSQLVFDENKIDLTQIDHLSNAKQLIKDNDFSYTITGSGSEEKTLTITLKAATCTGSIAISLGDPTYNEYNVEYDITGVTFNGKNPEKTTCKDGLDRTFTLIDPTNLNLPENIAIINKKDNIEIDSSKYTWTRDEGNNTATLKIPERVIFSDLIIEVFAEPKTEIFTYELNSDNESLTVKTVNQYIKYVTIPDEATYENKNYPVTKIGKYAFTGGTDDESETRNTVVKQISGGANITQCDEGAFFGCTELVRVQLSDFDKPWLKNESVAKNLFKHCVKLEAALIPDMWSLNITSVGEGAFYNCYSLKLNDPNDPSTTFIIYNSVSSIGKNAFYNWTDKQYIVVCRKYHPELTDSKTAFFDTFGVKIEKDSSGYYHEVDGGTSTLGSKNLNIHFPKKLSEYSWKTISELGEYSAYYNKMGYMENNSYIKNYFAVGDMTTLPYTTSEGLPMNLVVRIIGFNQDELVNEDSMGNTHSGITFQVAEQLGVSKFGGVSVQQRGTSGYSSLDSRYKVDSYASPVYTVLNDTTNDSCWYKKIDSTAKEYMKQVYKNTAKGGYWNSYSTSTGYSSEIVQSTNYFFPLSVGELGYTTTYGEQEGATYEYYNESAQTRRAPVIEWQYWTRSPYYYTNQGSSTKLPLTYYIELDGSIGTTYIGTSTFGILPAFCV